MAKYLNVFFLLVLACFVFISCTNYEATPGITNNTEESSSHVPEINAEQVKIETRSVEARAFSESAISDIISQDLENCTWNEGTELVRGIATSDPDLNYNGWLYSVETFGKPAGYLQILFINDNWHITSFSFSDTSLFETIRKANSRVVYIGGETYYTATHSHDHNNSNNTAYYHYITDDTVSYKDILQKYKEFINTLE